MKCFSFKISKLTFIPPQDQEREHLVDLDEVNADEACAVDQGMDVTKADEADEIDGLTYISGDAIFLISCTFFFFSIELKCLCGYRLKHSSITFKSLMP